MKEQRSYFKDKYLRSAQSLHFRRDVELVSLGIDYQRVTRLFRALHLDGADVLDIGCGDEPKALILAPASTARLVGIDVSAQGLSLSRELTEGYRGSFQGVLAEAANLPFANSTFSTVICYKTLEYIYQPQQALAEMSRVLRPGGSLFLCTLNRHFLFRALYRLFHPRHWREPFLPSDPYFDLPQLQAWCHKARLEVEACAYPWSFVSAAWDVWMLPRLVTRALKSRHASLWLKLLHWLRLPLMALAWLDRFFRLVHQSSVIVVVGKKMAA